MASFNPYFGDMSHHPGAYLRPGAYKFRPIPTPGPYLRQAVISNSALKRAITVVVALRVVSVLLSIKYSKYDMEMSKLNS